MARRHTTVDGVFASLDQLGWAKSRLRGLWKVDCEGFMASIAHHVLKAMRQWPPPRDHQNRQIQAILLDSRS